ncbi:MAG: choice-of-anchor L domain-containing protein [Bacteroidetes bacterium]|nr:choice-of-anchor L domain-containing protein [Bacteroidota bacterium]
MYLNRLIHKPVYSILGIALGLLPFFSKAQLTTSTAMTPAQLVQNVLLGSGIVATNITYTGDIQARGTFNGAASNVGLASGVILSSGDISNAVGPNNQTGVTTSNGLVGDPDLDQIMSPTLSYEAAILEFDFIPTSDTVKFRYVFGSDEYMEFVSTFPGGINDGFGFFISGPGITGPFSNNAKNIALVPGTSLPVTMFNLNLNNNGQYYFDNENPAGATIQYDGFTVPLTAITNVQCGSTYHIKIAIADGGDGIIDSGVFLEEGSFSSTGNVFITTNTDFGGNPGTNDTMFYEGCGAATITFDRGTTHLAFADTMNYIIDGTAGNGIDYSMITTEVIFAVGQQTATVVINSLSDLLTEGTETVILKVFNTSPCGTVNDTSTVTVYIVDSPPISVTLNNDTTLFCPSLNVPLTANATGGVAVGNYTYTWTNATSTSSTANVNPTVTTTYYVTVSDSCGNTASDSMIVNVIPYLPLQLSFNNDTTICGGNEVLLDANVTQGRPDYVYNWSPNITNVDSITVTPGSDITYTLTVTDACGLSVTDQVTVTVYPINADFVYNFTTNQTVDFTNLSTGGVTYFWNFGDGSFDSVSTSISPQHYYPTDGTYTVTLISTNQEGCSDTTQQTLVVLPDFYFYFPNAFTPNNNGKNDVYMGYGVGIKSYRMRIFDRWGELIFETTDLYTGWDGTYKGNKLPGGVYPVVFDLEGYLANPMQKYGHVTLIR